MVGLRFLRSKWLILLPLVALLVVAVACGDDAKPVPQVIEKEVIKEVPVEVIKEVIKEVPVEVVKEVIKEVIKEVVKEVEVPVTVVAVATPTPAPEVMMAKVERLVFVTVAPWIEIVLSWQGGSFGSNLVVRTHAEPLIETEYNTGKLVPGLATSWRQLTPDAKSWEFKLRENVPFHYDWGEFTSRDVVHTAVMQITEGLSTDARVNKSLFGETLEEAEQSFETPDDHTVVVNTLRPEADLDLHASAAAGNWIHHNKAQWDAQGFEGTRKEPAGTGSYKLIRHSPGFGILWEAVDQHWKKVPDFKEFEMVLVPEDATRMAMLLTGEAHMVELPRDVHADLVIKGMKVFSSVQPASQTMFLMGPVYRPDAAAHDPDDPFNNVLVREAINRIIPRDEIQNQIFKGVGEPVYVWGYRPNLVGWSERWKNEFDDKYGYNPERAKELLTEAGYANGFKTDITLALFAGFPEIPQLAEALFTWMNDIGIDVSIRETDSGRLITSARNRTVNNTIWAMRTGQNTSPGTTLRFYNVSPPLGSITSLEDKVIDDIYDQWLNSADKAERAQLLTQIGDWKFDNYAEAPLFWIPSQVVADPKVVADYTWPGTIDAGFDHFEYVVAAQG